MPIGVYPRKSAALRFFEKVNRIPDGCWEWFGARTRSGHGQFWTGKRQVTAHRYSWEMAHGVIPEGIVVRHACDNPPCVNPAHLSLGTLQDNARDGVTRKRRAGERNSNSRLKEADIKEIRRLRRKGHRTKDVAEMFGVALPTISNIVARRTWAHVS